MVLQAVLLQILTVDLRMIQLNYQMIKVVVVPVVVPMGLVVQVVAS